MKFTILVGALVGAMVMAAPPAGSGDAGASDAGAGPRKMLNQAECNSLMEFMVNLSVGEELAADPEVKKLSAEERKVADALAHKQALADPQLDTMKRKCTEVYDRKQEACIRKSSTMAGVDACKP